MFTGIIERVGAISRREPAPEGVRLLVATGFEDLALGESVAVNGICLTVAELDREGRAEFFASRETLERTALGDLGPSAAVNLERALPAQGRLSGHIVQGHVDGVGRVERISQVGDAREVEFSLPASLGRYCVEKGSIAIDGVSLTINSVQDSKNEGDETRISVMLIPHTYKHTRFGQLAEGSRVNIEADILAKYMERMCRPYQQR